MNSLQCTEKQPRSAVPVQVRNQEMFIEQITAANCRVVIKTGIPAPPLEREAGGREFQALHSKRTATASSEIEEPLRSSVYFRRGLRTVCSLMPVQILLYISREAQNAVMKYINPALI